MPATDAQTLREEHQEIMVLREEVRKDIALAIANFKVWLLVTVLSNVVLVGAPAFYVFISTSTVAETAFSISTTNSQRLDTQRAVAIDHDARLADIERFMNDKHGFVPREDKSVPNF